MTVIASFSEQQRLHQEISWIQSSPPILAHAASPYLLERPLPELCQKLVPEDSWIKHLLQLGQQPLLGIHYERLWQHTLRQLQEVELLAHNLQIYADSKTLGEFDLIYRNRLTGHYIHRELAVKFYLGLPDSKTAHSPWNQWIGPRLKDRLDRKMDRLLNHQILLKNTLEGQKVLEQLSIYKIRGEILLQGYLFYPVHGNCPPPIYSHPDHLKGFWISISQLGNWLDQQSPELQYIILPKSKWLAPYYSVTDIDELHTRQRLNAYLTAKMALRSSPILIAACDHCETRYKESFRFFVVSDYWQIAAMKTTNTP